ncbi:MAG: type II toxin-antitoxin system RelB/DinJ family antitoxin [Deltaproteobacteria bacterium]|jgi:DNA-damage-inducible protein J|nr:type II toxin-antitoxin system RelB/DinJ family antitoxin [Deltaproteobacteria bacterium]
MTHQKSYIQDVNKEIQDRASEILARIGLTIPEACRLFLTKITQDKDIIYDFLIPNAETLEAMQESQSGGGKQFKTFEDLRNYFEKEK